MVRLRQIQRDQEYLKKTMKKKGQRTTARVGGKKIKKTLKK